MYMKKKTRKLLFSTTTTKTRNKYDLFVFPNDTIEKNLNNEKEFKQ